VKTLFETELKWRDIIEATNSCKYRLCTGLRNRLFLDLNGKWNPFGEFVNVIRIFKLFLSLPKVFDEGVYENKVLFYFPFDTNANFGNLFPVYLETEKQQKVGLVIKTKRIKQLQDSIFKEDIFKYTIYSERILFFYLAIKSNCDLHNKFSKISKNISRNYFKQYFNFLYCFYEIYLSQAAFERILVHSKPISIISTSDFFPIDFALFNTANKLGIPNFIIQHGLIGISHIPFTAKKLIVYSHFNREELITKGVDPERIIVGGMPSSDEAFNHKVVQSHNLNHIKKVLILSDTQGASIYEEIYEKYFYYLKLLIQDNSEIEWLVKLHPSENHDLYFRNNFHKLKNFKILPKNISLSASFEMADIAITIWSTAGIDALFNRKALIILDLMEEVREYAWWPKYGGGIFYSMISKNADLKLDNVDFNKILISQESFLNLCFSQHGSSSEFISKIVSNA
jgi:hypothetical protein